MAPLDFRYRRIKTTQEIAELHNLGAGPIDTRFARMVERDVALFAHGHVLRVLVARWIGLGPSAGQHFLLHTGTLSVLGDYRRIPAVKIWNGPLID